MSAVRQQFWSSVQNFEENEIRTFFYAEQNLWLFSATDVWNTLNKNDEPNKNWDEIYITKNLVNWAKEGQTIDKFLNKYKGNKVIEYRFMESKTRKWRYPTISFPRDYSNDKIYLKDMITEKDGVLLCAILMYRVVMSQIIEISYIDD